MRLSGNVDNSTRDRCLDFGGDPPQYLDVGTFFKDFLSLHS